MADVLIGCGPFPPKRQAFLDAFRVVELTESFSEPIRHNTLRKWDETRPAGFEYVLGASRWLTLDPLSEKSAPPAAFDKRQFGLFAPSDANRAVWDEVRGQADALRADAVLFRSPPAFSPSQENLDNLRRFRESIIGEVPFDLVWEPRGIWQPAEVLALGEELGFTIVRDPHLESRLPDPVPNAYYAITAPAGHLRFSEDDLFDLNEFFDEHEGKVRAVFRGPDREFNARSMLQLRKRLSGG